MEGFLRVPINGLWIYMTKLGELNKNKLVTGTENLDEVQQKFAYGSGTTISESQNLPGKG